MSHVPFIVVDVETGGLDPQRHSLLQVAMLAYVNGEIIDRKSFYIKEEEYLVTPKAMEINGLNLSEVYAQGVEPRVAVQLIQSFVQKNFGDIDPPIMMGHNVNFDRSYIKHLFARFGLNLDKTINFRVFDTTTLILAAKAAGKLNPDAPQWLEGIANYFGHYPEKAHDALSDAETTVVVYETLIDVLKLEGTPWA